MSYYTDANASYVQSEANRLQMINIINNKFYLHKSFDIQSDMEFLPLIASNTNFGSSPGAHYAAQPAKHLEFFTSGETYKSRGGAPMAKYATAAQTAPPGLDTRDDGSDWVVNAHQNDKGW